MSQFSQPCPVGDIPADVCQQHFQRYPCGHGDHFPTPAPAWDKIGWTKQAFEAFAFGLSTMADQGSVARQISEAFGPPEESNPLLDVRQEFIRIKQSFAQQLKESKSEKQAQYDEDAAMRRAAKERADRDAQQRRIDGELSPAAEAHLAKLKAGVMSGTQLDELEDPVPVVDGWLYEDTLNWIAGPSGTFKSFVAHDLAARYASQSMSFHGFPMKHGKALYVIAEGAGMFKFRKRAWEHYNGKVAENITYYPCPVQISDFEAEMPALIAFAKNEGYKMVIFDTQAMCTVGDDENQAKDMGVIVSACNQLREATMGCVILVHHFDKGGNGMRGSGAQFGAAATVIATKREKDEEWVRLSTKKADGGKAKDDEGRDDLRLKLERYEPEDGSRGSLCPLRDDTYTAKPKPTLPTFDAERNDMLKRIVQFEELGGMSPTAIKEFLNEEYPKSGGGPYTTSGAEMHVTMLVNAGTVEKRAQKWWATELGKQAASALARPLDDADSDD